MESRYTMFATVRKLLWLLPRSDRWKLAGLLMLMVVGSLLEVIGIGMIPIFISIVAAPERILEIEQIAPVLAFFSIETGGDILVFGGILLVATFAIKNTYLIALHYLEAKFLFNRFSFIANRLFQSYMHSPYTFMLSRNTSEVLRNVTQESGIVVKHVMAPLLKLTMDAILILATLTLLFLVSPLITITAVCFLALVGGMLLKLIREKIQGYGLRSQTERKVMIQVVNEGLGGLKDVRVLQRSDWFLKRFRASLFRFATAQIFQAITKQATKPVLETFAVIGLLGIALALYWQGRGVDTIIPLLALFGAATIRLLPTVREVVGAINSLRFFGHAVHPIYDEIALLKSLNKSAVPASERATSLIPFEREIRFEEVGFAYPERELPAVSGLSLQIRKGEAVGFIGPSGAGKTTVIDLLLGILEPLEGRITVDGRDIRENPGGWLGRIGYVPQLIFLTDDTLRRNIALGLPDSEINDERMTAAIEAAQLSETIDQLPQGLETIVGERGVRLSGGQRQRIGIARALYQDPSVLILDEATSALDTETEGYVIESIERLKGTRTIIMISHRLTTVRNCDRLFVIENGRVARSEKCGEQLCHHA